LREAWLAEKGVTGALHTIFDRYVAEVFGARTAYRLHLDSITEAMAERLATSHLLEVDGLADQVCAEANADRWDRARTAPAGPTPSGGD
jgi:NAD(P)H dehydrogenase (quinone)